MSVDFLHYLLINCLKHSAQNACISLHLLCSVRNQIFIALIDFYILLFADIWPSLLLNVELRDSLCLDTFIFLRYMTQSQDLSFLENILFFFSSLHASLMLFLATSSLLC